MNTTWTSSTKGKTTTPAARAILEPCEEGEMLFKGDVQRYSDLAPGMARLLVELGAIDRHESQNNSPSFGDLIDLAEEFGLTLHGYRVPPERDDERISCEGLAGTVSRGKAIALLLSAVRDADDLQYDENTGEFFCWWD